MWSSWDRSTHGRESLYPPVWGLSSLRPGITRFQVNLRVLVVRRWEGQQVVRAGHRFCGSSEGTGVLAAKRLRWIPPHQKDVIRCVLAYIKSRWVDAGNADRQRFAIAGKATGTAGR
jgi:hypothetical protein